MRRVAPPPGSGLAAPGEGRKQVKDGSWRQPVYEVEIRFAARAELVKLQVVLTDPSPLHNIQSIENILTDQLSNSAATLENIRSKSAKLNPMMGEVELYGSLSSSTSMVDHALKLKGVVYHHAEDDLELDPVTDKLPVLVVDGKAIAGCLAILEFIDEMWKDKEPQLLPANLFKKARVRFWADFIYQKLVPDTDLILRSTREVQDEAVNAFMEHLTTLEDGVKQQFPRRGSFINGMSPGLLDVILGSCYVWFKILGEITGKELLDSARTPVLCECMAAYTVLEVVKDMTNPHIKMLSRILTMRKKRLLAAGCNNV